MKRNTIACRIKPIVKPNFLGCEDKNSDLYVWGQLEPGADGGLAF
jgi:hypothetical protein